MTEHLEDVTKPVKEAAAGTPVGRLAGELHTDRLMGAVQDLVGALGTRAVSSLTDRIEGTAGRLTEFAEGGGSGLASALGGLAGTGSSSLKEKLGIGLSAVKAVVKKRMEQRAAGKGGGRNKKLKLTNIVETIDVGVPVRLAYDQWTRFEDFPKFMKKVEDVQQESDEKLRWKAQILWSHRTWESTITEQVPDERIVWRSRGAKGYVDGAVTFHELTPDLTRIALVLEYHPQGLFEHTGNIWRAQGRRARLELKHFRRHVMTQSILHPEEVEGWRGEIRDGEVVEAEERPPDEYEEEERRPRGEKEPEYAEDPAEADEPEEEPEYAEERSEAGEPEEGYGPGDEYESGEAGEYEGEYAGEDEYEEDRGERERETAAHTRRREQDEDAHHRSRYREEEEEDTDARRPSRERQVRPASRADRR